MTMSPDNLPGTSAAQWLNVLYGDADPDQWLTIFAQDHATGDRFTEWATVAERDRLALRAMRHAERASVWFGVATRKAKVNGRGKGEDCSAFPGVWLDIDFMSPNHKTANPLPPDIDAAFDLLEEFPLPPTWVVSTGGGLQPWWLFREMVPCSELDAFLEAWQHTWATRASAHGWHLDNVTDRARVMRLPGTWNRKGGGSVEVVAVENCEHRYDPSDLDPYLTEPPVAPVRVAPRSVTPYIGPERPGDAFNLSVDCGQILARAGWTPGRVERSGDRHWTRPGKDPREGHSATVYADDGNCTVWTSSVPGLDERSAHDPFGLWCRIFHGGDFRSATRAAREMGYGARSVTLDEWIALPPRGATGKDGDEEPDEILSVPPAPEFPLDALPAVARDACMMVSAATQTPIDLAAQVALGVLAIVCTATRATIEVADGWTEGPNLYIATALPPGAGKSPVVGALAGPLDVLADEVTKAAAKARADHDSEERILKAKLSNAEKVIITGSDDGHRMRDEATLALLALERPPDGKLLVDDITPEAFVKVLWGAGGTIGVLSTEGGLFDQLSRYTRNGQPPNLDGMLKAWSGDTIRVDRVGSDAMVVRSPRASICLTVQPRVVERLYGDADFTGRGLVARFMLSVPEFAPGWRDLTTPIVIDADVIGRWGDLLHGIYRGHGTPTRYTLDPAARRMFNEWRQELEVGRRAGEPYGQDSLREATTKIDSSTVRTALLLHMGERRSSIEPVSPETMARAISIGRYWVAQAVRILAMKDVSPIVTDADRVLDWARRKGLQTLTVNVVRRSGVTARRVDGEIEGRDAAHVRVVLDELIHRGALRIDGEEYKLND